MLQRSRSASAALAATQEAVDAHHDDGGSQLFGITELCAEFGITLRTIRFYEDKGLLAPRRVSGARVYTRRDRARLALILRSKAIGASLDEIKHFLGLYGDHGEGRVQQMRYVVERTDEAIAELETKRAHIEATLSELRLINQRVREALASQTPKSAPRR
jgi:DNA-binding transcriptional MerR regulator